MKLRNPLPIVLIFWVATLAGALLFARRPAAEPIEILPPPTAAATLTAAPTWTPGATVTPRPLRIDVIGAVREPGVQTLPPGSIVDDAIRAAGGPSADADLDRVNKAVELQDGTQVYVPRRSDPTSRPVLLAPTPSPVVRAAPVRANPALAQALIDINSATLAELESLPSVGPKTAQLIVDGRPYATVDDLLRVKGIGPATLAKIAPFVTAQ